MKSRTFFLPMAFAVPAFISTVPRSAPALASAPAAARQNPLLGELDTVVSGTRVSGVLLSGTVAIVNDATKPPVSTTCSLQKNVKAIKVSSPPPSTTGRHVPTPAPVKKSNPATHKP